MNSLLFCTLVGFIIFISSSNASSSSSRNGGGGYGGGARGGYGDVTYRKERDDNRYSNYGQARDTKDRMYEGSYGKGREYDDDYDKQRTRERGYSTRGGGSSGSSSSSSSGGRSKSVSRGRRSNYGRDTRYGKGSDGGSGKGYDDGLIASLIQMNVDLYKKIKYLKQAVTAIAEKRPSFLALNYAICVGEEEEEKPMESPRRMEEMEEEEPAPCEVGIIVAYAGNADDLEDSNYRLADGAEIGSGSGLADFPALAARLSNRFGNGPDCDPCKLPNLSGRFILGVGDGFDLGETGGDSIVY